MAPWLADRMWLQVVLLSVYLFGFVATGTLVARQPDGPGETPGEGAVAAAVAALIWPVIAMIVGPLGFCWLLGRMFGGGR
jgi:hypothetical protein